MELYADEERLHRDAAYRRRIAARESYLVAAEEVAGLGFTLARHDDDHYSLTTPKRDSVIHIYMTQRRLFCPLNVSVDWPYVRLAPEVREWFGLLSVVHVCIQTWQERRVRRVV